MKLAFVVAIAMLSGCAGTRAALARSEQASGTGCTLLGEAVYNPRSGLIDPLSTEGPSRLVYINPGEPYLVNFHGLIYRCGSES